jgi:KaiC/GvpD/RAD55 family RecA-like ATPase
MFDPILLAQNATTACELLPALANRHGLITGATGTGKTITLQKLAESFSHMGVPVFMADVKGDQHQPARVALRTVWRLDGCAASQARCSWMQRAC